MPSPADALLDDARAAAALSPARADESGALRLRYLHPLLLSSPKAWRIALDETRSLGFSGVVTAPIFDPGPAGEEMPVSLFLLDDGERLHPALKTGGFEGSGSDVLRWLADEARDRGLGLFLDLALDRLAAGGALAERLGLQQPRGLVTARDPRQAPEARAAVIPDLQDDAAQEVFLELTARWEACGLAGFRCLVTSATPPEAWRSLIDRRRAADGSARYLGWFDGERDRNAWTNGAWAQIGFDAVFQPLTDAEGQIADLSAPWCGSRILYPEAPFGPRLAKRFASSDEAFLGARRALWASAALGQGLLLPLGYELGATRRLNSLMGGPEELEALRAAAPWDLGEEVARTNAFQAAAPCPEHARLRPLTAPGSSLRAFLVMGGNPDQTARLVAINAQLDHRLDLPAGPVLRGAGGLTRFRVVTGGQEGRVTPASRFVLDPGSLIVAEAEPLPPITQAPAREPHAVELATAAPRLAIESITPAVDGGAFPAKRILGEVVVVEADIFADGHDRLAAVLLWRTEDETTWREVPMKPLGNDRWRATFPLERLGRHRFTVEAWRDDFATYLSEIDKKHAAGVPVSLELREGRAMVEAALGHCDTAKRSRIEGLLERLDAAQEEGGESAAVAIFLEPRTREIMAEADPRPFALRHDPPLVLDAEPLDAAFASWYEIFPRSQSGEPGRHGTFADVEKRLPAIRDMGFDVLYFPPIHPIGRTNRKGRNNSLKAGPDDPGSPYAIGAPEGGHDAIHPELGSLEDFRSLIAKARAHDLEIALDFAIQCSPDHPWLREHPEWFAWRPDGSVRFAENPPKKYEDIVNVDFYAPGALPSLWLALRDVVAFWVRQGVRLFRVDNPHTKPFAFWEWLIADIRAEHPEVLFLSEAFTRPKVMYRLAKIGFSQSYTYFTWRNTKAELTDYLEELSTTAPKDFFRPHFFVNTPDINPEFLHSGKRPAFLIRAALAATLSGLWGVYNGFELCEGRAVPGKEEYLDSEKYEIKVWDYDRPGNIVTEITQLNAIRRANPALQSHLGVSFLEADNDRVLYFEKATPERDNVVLVAISLDPEAIQETAFALPLWKWGLPDHGALAVQDLMSGDSFQWNGKWQRLRLDPAGLPFRIWRVRPLR